jgi:hypothetical protein
MQDTSNYLPANNIASERILFILSNRANTRPGTKPKITVFPKHTFYTGHGYKLPRVSQRHPVTIHHHKIDSQDEFDTPNSQFDVPLSQTRIAFMMSHDNNQSTNSPLPEHY